MDSIYSCFLCRIMPLCHWSKANWSQKTSVKNPHHLEGRCLLDKSDLSLSFGHLIFLFLLTFTFKKSSLDDFDYVIIRQNAKSSSPNFPLRTKDILRAWLQIKNKIVKSIKFPIIIFNIQHSIFILTIFFYNLSNTSFGFKFINSPIFSASRVISIPPGNIKYYRAVSQAANKYYPWPSWSWYSWDHKAPLVFRRRSREAQSSFLANI